MSLPPSPNAMVSSIRMCSCSAMASRALPLSAETLVMSVNDGCQRELTQSEMPALKNTLIWRIGSFMTTDIGAKSKSRFSPTLNCLVNSSESFTTPMWSVPTTTAALWNLLAPSRILLTEVADIL